MPSFDAVSELNAHEVANAVDQANRELAQRFDFKDTGARFELKEFTVTLQAAGGLSAQADARDPEAAAVQARHRPGVPRDQGAAAPRSRPRSRKWCCGTASTQETGKKIARLVKDSKLKVQASLQGDKVRITGKQRDDLQAAMALLRGAKLDVPLQFNNFRD